MTLDELKALVIDAEARKCSDPDEEPVDRVTAAIRAAKLFYRVHDGAPVLPPGTIAICSGMLSQPLPGAVVIVRLTNDPDGRDTITGLYYPGKGKSAEIRPLAAPDTPGVVLSGKRYSTIRPIIGLALPPPKRGRKPNSTARNAIKS